MYNKFFGFKEKPFTLVPNPKCLYLSKKHQNALTYLEYGLSEGSGFILLTGDIGAGKTTVIRYILNRLDENEAVDLGVISNTNVNSGELLKLVMHEFGIEAPEGANKAKCLEAIFKFLIKEYSRGRKVVLVVDEAQNLADESLEEIRMISNLQTDDQILLQIILIGQPNLKQRLSSPNLTQLSQRIAVFYHLSALDRDEVTEYISFRLKRASGHPDIFAEAAIDLLFKASGGIPRIINILCDTALVYAYAESYETITVEIMQQVIRDKEGLGLVHNELTTNTSNEETTVTTINGNDLRLIELEYKVAHLQKVLKQELSKLEQERGRENDLLVTKLTEQLKNERARSDRLMVELERLKTEYEVSVRKYEMARWSERKVAASSPK